MIDSTQAINPPLAESLPHARSLAGAVEWPRALTLTLVLAAALAVRLVGLGATGFSEDEINKLQAVDAYRHFDFSANAEHPMLMKLADWVSLDAAEWWNVHEGLAAIVTIPREAALRLPNALAGAAATGVIFLLVEALFDAAIAGWASLLWALDANAAAINRIGKEDTLLLLFLLLAAYFYERAKIAGPVDPARRRRWFNASGASFGLMLASKYMPHYFGLHALFNYAADRAPTDDVADKRPSFFAAMGGAFLVANFAVMLPATWRYLAGYARGDTMRHLGYDFVHRIYVNTMGATPWGIPPTFYLTAIATKVPLVVVALAVVGIVWTARHSAHRGATFIRIFLVFTLLPYSLVASKFLRYMLPMLAVIDIAAAVGLASVVRAIERLDSRSRPLVAAAATAVIALALSTQLAAAAPFYALAQNAIGALLVPRAALFPDDELYDAGVREAVQAIAATAGRGALVCSDAEHVVSEYLRASGRTDMRSCSMSHDGLPMAPVETWVIVQPGHIYFENADMIEQLGARGAPWLELEVGGAPAAQVYRFR
jgi:Dolichyl-phosphate-mannose-protein mannosyltransferase